MSDSLSRTQLPHSFSLSRLLTKSLRFNLLPNLAVMASVGVATAVIVGALLVGDSVRGSLRYQALDRLGGIDGLLVSRGFIASETLNTWNAKVQKQESVQQLHGFILFPRSSVELATAEQTRRSSNVLVMGIEEGFWSLSSTKPKVHPQAGEVVINEELAKELQISVGDELTVRLPSEQAVPADSPLGRREGQTVGLPRIKVIEIIPSKGLARFDVRNNQQIPRNLFLNQQFLQEKLDRIDQVNAVAVSLSRQESTASVAADSLVLKNVISELEPSLADLRLKLTETKQVSPTGTPVFDYYSLSSDEMIIDPAVQAAVMGALPRGTAQPVFTYLANSISKISTSNAEGEPVEIPYSTITGINPSQEFPLTEAAGLGNATILKDGQAIINSWLAEKLTAKVGDRLRIFYYLPETVHGKEVEQSFDIDLVGIAPLTEPSSPYRRNREARFDQPPTIFNDPNLTPEVPGITDQDSINDWDTPFTLTRKISADDDDYWNKYRLTPKLFMPYNESVQRFGSRFGQATSIRISRSASSDIEVLRKTLADAIRPRLSELGFELRPIKAEALQASSGTTPFDGLFLGLSMLVIGSALMLIALLFRLNLERRAEQWGIYLALGWPWKRLRWLLLSEGLVLSIAGSIAGLPLGIFYARLMLAGLSGWWLGAVTVPFLEFFMTSRSLLIGAISGICIAVAAIYVALRALRRQPATALLQGKTEQIGLRQSQHGRWLAWTSIAGWILGAAIALAGITQSGQAQAGMFVGGGMILLIAAMGLIHSRLLRWQQGQIKRTTQGDYSLMSLAARNIGRNPLRSTLTLGLLAVTSFLILALSAFQIRPSQEAVGGFRLIGESSSPIFQNIGDRDVRREYLGEAVSKEDSQWTIFAFKMRPGDEASCNNLYQSTEPKIVAASSIFADWEQSSGNDTHFPWASKQNSEQTPWQLLQSNALGTADSPLPVILDLNTAMWSLHLKGAIGEVFSYEFGEKQIYFKTVGLLNNSLLQGMLIIGETNFQTSFPDISGYQFFLARDSLPFDSTPPASADKLVEFLEKGWGDEGLDLVSATNTLNQLLAVQNTYLKAFQSLGALGLLLGTIGLAIVQIRSVLERRSELATLRAIGFTPGRIRQLILLENCLLLAGGVLVGGITAILCVAAPLAQNSQFTEVLQPLSWLVAVLGVGLIAGSMAVRIAGSQPLLSALRQR